MDRRIAMLSLFALLPALAVAENRNQSGWPVLGTAPGSIEQTFIEEDAFPLTRELLERSHTQSSNVDYRVAPELGLRLQVPAMGSKPVELDFAFPVIEESNESQPVDAPIHFDAPPTLAAATLLR